MIRPFEGVIALLELEYFIKKFTCGTLPTFEMWFIRYPFQKNVRGDNVICVKNNLCNINKTRSTSFNVTMLIYYQ